MKKIILQSLCFIMVCIIPIQAQISTIVETTQGIKDTIPESSAQIVDINGTLKINVSKTELLKRIKTEYPQYKQSIDLQSNIDALEKALVNQESMLNYLSQNTLNSSDKTKFYQQLNSFFTYLASSPDNSELRTEANSIINDYDEKFGRNNPNTGMTVEYYLLTNLNNNLETVKNSYSKISTDPFTVSMLGYIITKLSDDNRIHIRNFDTYTDKAIYTVPRWVTSLSTDQSAQLEELKKKATTYNQQAPNYFKNLKSELLGKFPNLACIDSLKIEIQGFLDGTTISSTLEPAVKADINNLVTKYGDLINLVSNAKLAVSSWDINTPFEVEEQIKTLIKTLSNTQDLFGELANTVNAVESLKVKAEKLGSDFKDCLQNTTAAINALAQSLGLLRDQQNRFDINSEIVSEILRFSIDDLPSTGYIKLEGTGPRENGDRIEIDLVISLPNSTPSNSSTSSNSSSVNNHILETRTLTMQIIGLRSETVVGIIMANSYNEQGFTPVEDRKFLYAPAASLLLKVGSRKSKLYNEFIDFGFGISVSTPDFNTDGTPEFGVGLMFTAFKDILSVGINYNVTLDTPYWSFGINLPFNLPGIPINTPK